jgi:hypothetical protein
VEDIPGAQLTSLELLRDDTTLVGFLGEAEPQGGATSMRRTMIRLPYQAVLAKQIARWGSSWTVKL